ncbi:hypothetical protein EJ03DRAFT_61577 [Teratosphaeria nubilosa]|uniref:Uncharacterized protein n=1 Tax=Teratosphaeria nubilosa TaxID=161662 RepID=A0A6G1LDI4_9PEZI|nr:hypothetical protein EJ03DRAFT_61577 [Teratosphaeria nubilosa]
MGAERGSRLSDRPQGLIKKFRHAARAIDKRPRLCGGTDRCQSPPLLRDSRITRHECCAVVSSMTNRLKIARPGRCTNPYLGLGSSNITACLISWSICRVRSRKDAYLGRYPSVKKWRRRVSVEPTTRAPEPVQQACHELAPFAQSHSHGRSSTCDCRRPDALQKAIDQRQADRACADCARGCPKYRHCGIDHVTAWAG